MDGIFMRRLMRSAGLFEAPFEHLLSITGDALWNSLERKWLDERRCPSTLSPYLSR
jgi:hypothetical protein